MGTYVTFLGFLRLVPLHKLAPRALFPVFCLWSLAGIIGSLHFYALYAGYRKFGRRSAAARRDTQIPPQPRPGTASRPASLDGRRCLSKHPHGRRPQEALLRRRRRGSPPFGSYAVQLGVLASRFARSNLLEQCSHRGAASGRLPLRASLRSPLRTFALKSSAPWRLQS